jgi:ABC-type multidrug transport system fused ATPase/permease subunit
MDSSKQLISLSWFVAAVVVMVSILPWIVFFLVPITIFYVMIHRHYRKSGADLQRLDALSRSPLQTMLVEAIEGSATIRTFHKELTFMERFQDLADKSTAAQMNFIVAQRWLGVRIELLGAAIVFCTSLFVIIFWDSDFFNLDAGMVALLIRWSSGLTISLSFLCDNAAEAEGAVTAIERIQQMSEIAQELNFAKMPNFDESWPPRGELEFRDVRMRYRPQLPLSLDCLSFRVEAGEHCGVVGRTGAGKSSLLTALFRLVEIEGGCVTIDGVDLSKIGLSDVRGRPNGISIIPQDPFLFAGTMRECLDPFSSSTDDDLLDALASVRMLPPEKRAMAILDSRIEEGGTNYSVGQRSLLVLARALLARPKVLLMDEATGKWISSRIFSTAYIACIRSNYILILTSLLPQPTLTERPTNSSKECYAHVSLAQPC